MRITYPLKALQAGLKIVGAARKSSSPLPILQHVLIASDTLTCTDLDLRIQHQVEGTVDESGSRTVHHKTLTDWVALAKHDVVMELRGSDLHISSGRAKTVMPSLPAEEFPAIAFPDSPPTLFPQGSLQQAVRRVLTSRAASEETRAVMTGTQFLWGPDGVCLCCTSGRSLGYQTIPGNHEPREAIIGGAQHILALNGDIEMRISDGTWSARSGPTTMGGRLLEGTFPDWSKLLKWEPVLTVLVDRAALLESLRRVLLFAQEKTSPGLVVVRIERDYLQVSSHTPGVGESTENVQCTSDGELALAFNGGILLEALSVADVPTIAWELQDATKAARMKLGQFTHVAMPVRMREVANV